MGATLTSSNTRNMMLLKCCVLILMLPFHYILCSDEKLDSMKNTSDSGNFSKLENSSLSNTTNDKNAKLSHIINDVHYVNTDDGFILTILRLSQRNDEAPSALRPVLLVHGMYQSSDKFTKQEKSQSLADKLKSLGYDVWLFNARGNKYCRNHTSLNPETDKEEFFNHSYEEVGYFDIAAVVDYMLTQNRRFKKIHYIGHSFGGTYFLILNELRPHYNAKFHSAYLMAPVAFHEQFTNTQLLQDFVNPEAFHKELLSKGIYELFPYNSASGTSEFTAKSCLGHEDKWGKICDDIEIQKFLGLKSNNNSRFDTRGGSVKQLVHWAQNIQKRRFRRWDHKGQNEKIYGFNYWGEPPEYNLSAVTVPTTIIYSMTDELVGAKDIEKLAKVMGNASMIKVEKTNFRHDDFINDPSVMTHVYSRIIASLAKQNGPDKEDKPDKGYVLLPWHSILVSSLVCHIFVHIRGILVVNAT